MNVKAEVFGKLLKKVASCCEVLGYEDIKVNSWTVKDNKFCFHLIDGKTNEDLHIQMPLPKQHKTSE